MLFLSANTAKPVAEAANHLLESTGNGLKEFFSICLRVTNLLPTCSNAASANPSAGWKSASPLR
ncbi:hypothetical protein [Neisseria weixii]|uniref:hypothetical protein n=1 Tax=Neisseria weixii TaxID=1853276 RepID=UPI001E421A57|nr:hypothetical protein [Neisseria weixii]